MRIITLLLAACLAFGCATVPNEHELLGRVINHKYPVDALFIGERLKLDTDQIAIIDDVVIRSRGSSIQFQFVPADRISLIQGLLYFTNVWSPDQEFLLLPLGQSDGFAAFSAKALPQKLTPEHHYDTISLSFKSGTKLAHRFVRWNGKTSFLFQAGLSDLWTTFQYDFADHTLCTVSTNPLQGVIASNRTSRVNLVACPPSL